MNKKEWLLPVLFYTDDLLSICLLLDPLPNRKDLGLPCLTDNTHLCSDQALLRQYCPYKNFSAVKDLGRSYIDPIYVSPTAGFYPLKFLVSFCSLRSNDRLVTTKVVGLLFLIVAFFRFIHGSFLSAVLGIFHTRTYERRPCGRIVTRSFRSHLDLNQ
jgi:hypothetical protein